MDLRHRNRGTANTSNIKPIATRQNKIVRHISKAPWYVPNNMIQTDIQINTLEIEIGEKKPLPKFLHMKIWKYRACHILKQTITALRVVLGRLLCHTDLIN